MSLIVCGANLTKQNPYVILLYIFKEVKQFCCYDSHRQGADSPRSLSSH